MSALLAPAPQAAMFRLEYLVLCTRNDRDRRTPTQPAWMAVAQWEILLLLWVFENNHQISG